MLRGYLIIKGPMRVFWYCIWPAWTVYTLLLPDSFLMSSKSCLTKWWAVVVFPALVCPKSKIPCSMGKSKSKFPSSTISNVFDASDSICDSISINKIILIMASWNHVKEYILISLMSDKIVIYLYRRLNIKWARQYL